MESWRKAAKDRLRALAIEQGSQRRLAKAWLGDAKRATQINQWVSESTSDFPDRDNLILLRERLGVSLDWLLGEEPKSEPAGTSWPTGRRQGLADELSEYAADVLNTVCDYITSAHPTSGDLEGGISIKSILRGKKTLSKGSHEYLDYKFKAALFGAIWYRLRGSPLRYLEQQLALVAKEEADWLLNHSNAEAAAELRRHRSEQFRARQREAQQRKSPAQ